MATSDDKLEEEIPMQTTLDMSNAADAPDGLGFGMTVDELRELMEYRGGEAVQLISVKYRGAGNICRKLLTDENTGMCRR